MNLFVEFPWITRSQWLVKFYRDLKKSFQTEVEREQGQMTRKEEIMKD